MFQITVAKCPELPQNCAGCVLFLLKAPRGQVTAARAVRLDKVVVMMAEGHTTHSIARAFGISITQAHEDIKIIRARWMEAAATTIEEARVEAIEQAKNILVLAGEAYQSSRGRRGGPGDPRFLRVGLEALDRIMVLQCLNNPPVNQLNLSVGTGGHDSNVMSAEELAELFSSPIESPKAALASAAVEDNC